ncbi:CsbD domain-containing protein [Balamuthia mandrillaris]
MSFEANKTTARKDQLIGGLKEGTGKLLGAKEMEAKGTAQKELGHNELRAAQAKAATKGAGQKLGGHIKEAAGSLTGDKALKAEGKADQLAGDRKVQHNK